MLASGKVNVLALIGSSKVADHLKKQHPKSHRLRAILGLDAKNAAIVLPDADIELTVKECLLGTLSFNGQRCTALKMLIVHESIAERFLERFTEELAKLKVGMPWEKGVTITPLPGLHRTAYMTEAIEDAKAKGARVVNEGGGDVLHDAVTTRPCVYPVREGMKLYREEQFGPIIPVMPFVERRGRARIRQSLPTTASRSASSGPIPVRSVHWLIRWSTRSAGSTSIASASGGLMSSRLPVARIPPKERCR